MDEERQKRCRLCLYKTDLIDFDVINKRHGISGAALIQDCLSIIVSKEDGLPYWLCMNCSNKLTGFYTYKKECINTIESLKSCIKAEYKALTKKEMIEDDDFTLDDMGAQSVDKDASKYNTEKTDQAEIEYEDVEVIDELWEDDDFIIPKPKVKDYTNLSQQKHFRLRCDKCDLTFKRRKEYTKHKEKVHGTLDLKHKCYCGMTFLRLKAYEQHKFEVHKESLYMCEFCSKSFCNRTRLRVHIKNLHNQMNGRTFSCPTCLQVFTTFNDLQEHKQTHKQAEKFICDYCGKEFRAKMYLRRHIDVVHTICETYVCSICGNHYKTKAYRDLHENLHIGREKDDSRKMIENNNKAESPITKTYYSNPNPHNLQIGLKKRLCYVMLI